MNIILTQTFKHELHATSNMNYVSWIIMDCSRPDQGPLGYPKSHKTPIKRDQNCHIFRESVAENTHFRSPNFIWSGYSYHLIPFTFQVFLLKSPNFDISPTAQKQTAFCWQRQHWSALASAGRSRSAGAGEIWQVSAFDLSLLLIAFARSSMRDEATDMAKDETSDVFDDDAKVIPRYNGV